MRLEIDLLTSERGLLLRLCKYFTIMIPNNGVNLNPKSYKNNKFK